jgi:tetratricopeptide (TPR) repeat protein
MSERFSRRPASRGGVAPSRTPRRCETALRLSAAALVASLVGGVLASPTLCAGGGEERLSAYLRVAERFRVGEREEAVEALGRWRPRELEAAQRALAAPPERLSPCVGEPETVGVPTVEAAVLLHVQVALRAHARDDTDGFRKHLRLAQDLLEWVRKATADWEEGAGRGPSGTTCAYAVRLPRRAFYFALSGLLLAQTEPRLAREAAERGLDAAPDDAPLLLAAACAHELTTLIWAQFVSQPFLRRLSPAQFTLARLQHRDVLDGIETEQKEARDLLRRALDRDPTLAAAHLRLGRLLAQEGRLDAAETELAAAGSARDADTRCLADLFRGGLCEAHGNLAGAEALYRDAIQILPRTQAARIALAHVLEVSGRTEAARRLVMEVLRSSRPRDPFADPWWRYPFGTAREAEALFESLCKRVGSPP